MRKIPKTLEDVKRVAEMVDRLRETGIAEEICADIEGWNKEQEERINAN